MSNPSSLHPTATWSVPDGVALDVGQDALVVPGGGWETLRRPDVQEDRDLLFEFLALSAATGDEVLAFAEREGVLDLCRHGLPRGHRRPQPPANRTVPNDPPGGPVFARGFGPDAHVAVGFDEPSCEGVPRPDPYIEPIAAWHRFARQGSAILTLAEGLRVHSTGRDENWEPLDDPPVFPGQKVADLLTTRVTRLRGDSGKYEGSGAPSRKEQVAEQRAVLAQATDAWLAWGNVALSNYWGAGSGEAGQWDVMTVRLQGRGLFGALAVQLNAEVAGRHSWATCVNCGLPYLPKRTPREGEATYCQRVECQKARNRDNVKKHRQRSKP